MPDAAPSAPCHDSGARRPSLAVASVVWVGDGSALAGGTFVTQAQGRDLGLPQIMNRHLKDEAYRVIKEAITTLQFRPGEPVMEGKLAKSLGISKTPVRNALVRLEVDHLSLV